MNERHRSVAAEFGPETRFEINPSPPAPFRAVQENRFELLKLTLLEDRLKALRRPELSAHVRRAANEAAAVAWVTPYPLLVFPVLFAEKAEAVHTLHAETLRTRQPAIYAYEATATAE
jgi:hypothetical protein